METLGKRFEDLYLENREDLYVYIHRFLREENTARDILQDTFLNFFRIFKDRELPGKVDCRKYLFRAARNLSINHSQRAYARKVSLTPDYAEVRRSTGETPEEQVLAKMEREETEARLQEYLKLLTEQERTALHLRFHSEMRLEEIADVLEVSISTASRLVQRAIDKLSRAEQERAEP